MIRRKTLLTLIVVLLMIQSVVIETQSVRGQENATPTTVASRQSLAFEFYPTESGWGSFFDVQIDVGQTAQVTVTIANVGDVTQGIKTYVTNGFTAPGGGFAAAEYGVPLNEVSQWLDYPEETFTLDAGEGVERTFSVTVPEDTAPGQYITAIAGEHAEASAVEGQPNLSQKLRYSVPVFIRVPGATDTAFHVERIDLQESDGVGIIIVSLQNTGDIRVRPEGVVEARTIEGELVVSIPVAMESIYAREGTDLRLALPQNVGTGTYDVSVALTDPDSGVEAGLEENGLELFVAGSLGEPVIFTFADTSLVPQPDAANIQFVTIDAVILNAGEAVTNAQLSLVANLDGQELERFAIGQSLALPTGETPITARYIPVTGWTSGTWSFELLLESVESGGAAVVQAVYVLPDTLEIE